MIDGNYFVSAVGVGVDLAGAAFENRASCIRLCSLLKLATTGCRSVRVFTECALKWFVVSGDIVCSDFCR